ncbi:MAG TPA: MarR family transcriptional regulator [Herpetosiphonaceae bacterium]|nr:MarR family transcriptional regulator [Herpetosiphonaceae bacterium]
MNDLYANAKRMVSLFEQMRHARSSPAFALLKQLNLSFSHMAALRLLAPDNVLTMKEIAERLQITPPSVTVLVRRLEQTRLVRRMPHQSDSRVTLLSLTDQGRQFHEQFASEHVENMVHLLKGLSADEQAQFLDLLERAVKGMIAADLEANPDQPNAC